MCLERRVRKDDLGKESDKKGWKTGKNPERRVRILGKAESRKESEKSGKRSPVKKRS